MLSLKVKIKLDYNQQVIVETMSNEHRLLYNYLLQSIKESSKTFKELNQIYKNYRNDNCLTINSKSAQNTCISFINNIKSFYALHKKDKSVQFPYKFKSYKYFKSFMFDYNKGDGGFILKNNQLMINLFGNKKTRESKDLIIDLPKYVTNKINDNNIKTLTFTKEDNGDYYLVFIYGESNSNKIINKDFLSIDLGYSQLVTCYSNKIDNFSVENLKLKKLQKRIEYLQSYKDSKKKHSNSYNKINKSFKRVKKKQVNKLKDFQHKLSTKIISICKENQIGNLIVGDIQVKKVIFNKINDLKKQIKQAKLDNDVFKEACLTLALQTEYKKQKINGLSKSTTLGRFKTFLEYKSIKEGMEFHSINEAFTSQQNCITDEIMYSSNLSNRSVEVKPGVVIDRDLNSAINIAKKCKVTWLDHQMDFNLSKMYLNVHANELVKYE